MMGGWRGLWEYKNKYQKLAGKVVKYPWGIGGGFVPTDRDMRNMGI
jgi:hypothetical protein